MAPRRSTRHKKIYEGLFLSTMPGEGKEEGACEAGSADVSGRRHLDRGTNAQGG